MSEYFKRENFSSGKLEFSRDDIAKGVARYEAEIDRLKKLIKEGRNQMLSVCDLKGCDFDDIHEWLNKIKDIK